MCIVFLLMLIEASNLLYNIGFINEADVYGPLLLFGC